MESSTLPPGSEFDDVLEELEQLNPLAEMRLFNLDLKDMAAGLADLAAELTPAQAQGELVLRDRFLAAQRSLFSTRLEKGAVLAQFKALYSPIRKWAEFLRVISMPRRTAYNLIAAALEAGNAPTLAGEVPLCADLAHSRPKEPRHRDRYDIETAVDKAIVCIDRIFGGFTEAQQESLRSALADRLGAGKKTRLALWPPFQTDPRAPVQIL